MKALIPPPLVTLICGTLMWLAARWSPSPSLIFEFPRNTLVFWIVLGIGCAILASGISAIFKHNTVIHPNRKALSKAAALVTTGIFRYSRNPIYLGMTIMLVAWAIRLENWLSAAGVIIFIVFITIYQIKPEEEALEKIFGEDYLRYKGRVRRWL